MRTGGRGDVHRTHKHGSSVITYRQALRMGNTRENVQTPTNQPDANLNIVGAWLVVMGLGFDDTQDWLWQPK